MCFSFHVLVYFIDKKSDIKVWKLLLFIIVFGKLFRGFFRSKTKLHVHYCHPVWKIYFIWYNTMYCSLFFCKWHVHVSLIMSIFTARRFLFQIQFILFQMNRTYIFIYIFHVHVSVHKPSVCDWWYDFDIDDGCLLLYFTKSNVNEYKNVSRYK